MSRRPLILTALTLAMTVLAACSDSASPTQPSSITPATKASQDVAPPVCRDGGWNSSTGRCE